ncbi:MAG: DUF6345 domain-containing protein [Candidatus Thorarchaeota archaeon]
MRREAILLFVLFLLVVSVSDRTDSPVDFANHEPMNFILSQTEMPVYELVTPVVNETYVQSLASSLFGIHDIMAQETEGIYYVNWSNSYLEVDSTDGSIWFADYDRLWNISSGDELPDATESQTIAEAWLDEKGLVPANAEFAGIGTTNMTIYNPETEVMHSKIINYHFDYEFAINDIPIAEESAGIKVVIGETGAITGPAENIVGFDWKWRDIQPTPYTTAVLIEFDSILATYGISADDVVAYSLVYDTGETDADNDLLVPVYDIELTKTNGLGINFTLKIDATEFDPHVEITQPSGSITVQPGTPITFDCNVIFGTPPYAYQWSSHVDGILFQSATTSSFTTSTLSEAIKSNIPYHHSISVLIRDSEDRYARDEIAVKIDSTAAMSIDIGIVMIGLGAVILLSASLIVAKKKGTFVIFFLLMLLSSFVFIPVTSAYSEAERHPVFRPSAPTGAYDDGIKEIGIEWVGLSYSPSERLSGSQTNTEGFYNHMGSIGGYGQEFNWGEYGAWEEDFRDITEGLGNDSQWIDCVDMVYYQGHGGPRAVTFTSDYDKEFAYFSQMKLGDGDLETIIFDSCSVLAWYDPYDGNIFERWSPALQGVHQVCGFATGAKNRLAMGSLFAQYMTGLYPLPALTIMESWFRAAIEEQPSGRKAAMFYGTNSSNPFQPQLDDPINDHAEGFGYVCSDPTPDVIAWYVFITTSC